ncbi:MAG: KpsF/GutQ family sugar-phosphate isomerase [Candidatus Xiphinematobacter sp.]|nr:MAG: KpsF/GutQ family sugar-phosphate isomerase [Candidatus Xiphinematobacter sp.]QQY09796.1 MAG: KpsF/GutQ family sugar-phosphate isomerase [Candidatus Xiphinematobacter sp.]QQY10538.1 MAG: KpsF/GutQ family sugar-phosphate isomerase [Candidatus Xiphinematobacter sp.]QQY11275.1 MAG: KpsF/GutQ family sugar-phosphate isomerase [Candidatus Xiphinematobacter sp.]
MDYLERARRVVSIEMEEVCRVGQRLGASFLDAVNLIKATLQKRGKIVVVGVGKSGHIGKKIAATLTSTGSTAVVLSSLNALHGDLGIVAGGDVVLFLSYSGETEEIVGILPALIRFDVKMIAMTGSINSSLARASDIVLDVAVSREACPLSLSPTSSTTAMLVIGDALAMVLLETNCFSAEDFAKFHPGGRLGRSLLLKVRDVMRTREEMALVLPSATVLEAVQKMTHKRCGCVTVVDSSGYLSGIFTQGDFARHFPSSPDIGGQMVEKFVTRHPVTVIDSKPAAEVLRILRKHRIDDLVVVDTSNRPIGLVDSQDLTRLKLA